MATVWDIPSVWRANLMPASFRNAGFHCESNSQESGRRVVEHEFPKKDYPYAEDMGRQARTYSIRGYCIVYPRDDDEHPLFQRNYITPRNLLIAALEVEGPGRLRLPTLGDKIVVCTKYRITEEERFGGFCVFDMQFVEQGIDPQSWLPAIDTATVLQQQSQNLRNETQRVLANPPAEVAA